MQSAVWTHSDSGFSESERRLRQTSLLLQTHLMRLHSLSQLLEIFLSLLDSLLERLLRLLQVSLLRKKCLKMLHYIQHTTKSLYKSCVDPIFVEWISGSNHFWNVSYEMQTQNVLDIYSYKRLLQNNILHISYLKLTPRFKI